MDELIEGEVYWWEPSLVNDDYRAFPYPTHEPQWVAVAVHGVSLTHGVYTVARAVDCPECAIVVPTYELFNLDADGGLVPLMEYAE